MEPGRSKNRIYLGAALLFCGLMLITICILGESGGMIHWETSPKRPWERFDARLGTKSNDLPSLYAEAEKRHGVNLGNLSDADLMSVLFTTMCDRFAHRQARYSLFSNWILWAMGKLCPPFGAVHEPNNLLKYGNVAICDQQSYLLVTLALKRGIKARHVGLGGHIVMEAWYDGDWHMYDPDEEVIAIDPENTNEGVLSVQFLSRNPDFTRKLYSKHRSGPILEKIVGFYSTRENNSFVSVPEGSWFNWKSQVLMMFEKSCAYLKWIIPVCLSLFGGLFIIFSKRRV